MAKDFTIANGAQVSDRVTGFTGTVIGRVDYITGCNQYLVQPRVRDRGEFVESRWFDEHRLCVDRALSPLTLPTHAEDGADKAAPRK